ncbi:Sulfite reductase [ferredoxin] [bacterium HR18]|nr:Sulfite reductase [ferredoxin] [bacterium HR18]
MQPPDAIPNLPFSEEQKQYLQGFMAGVLQRGGLTFVGQTADGRFTHQPEQAVRDLAATPAATTFYGTPVDRLCKQEHIKLELHPLDMWDRVLENAAAGRFPEGDDVFRYKALGLFYVAPAQNAFMLRCRIAGGLLSSHQARGLAELAMRYGGGYLDLTTRANIQVREIRAQDAANVLMALADLGLTSRGAGADNIRNITATPTTGFDVQELFDLRPLVRALYYYILHSRDLYNLPRKFNVAFDSGGVVTAAAETNDLGFIAVRVEEGHEVAPGVYFRIELGGVTGHGSFAQDTGYMVPPEACLATAAAIIRVYLEHGDRTNRKKARLKYLLEAWGPERFMEAVQKRLAFPLVKLPRTACWRPSPRPNAHVGIHPQKPEGHYYIGIDVPVGRLQADQLRALADIADRYGTGELRLTVFQNLLIPGIPEAELNAACDALHRIGLSPTATALRQGLVACTGNAGCPYARTNTKAHALELVRYLEETAGIRIDQPLNIHLTGCPHSCAQHYCGDIGLLGVKVQTPNGETVEGYDIVVGGGLEAEQGLARPLARSVPFENVPPLIAHLLRTYLNQRQAGESFAAFTRRLDEVALQQLTQEAKPV